MHFLVGGFKYFWYFHPYFGEMAPILTNMFSKGLVQPPTRFFFSLHKLRCETEVKVLEQLVALKPQNAEVGKSGGF